MGATFCLLWMLQPKRCNQSICMCSMCSASQPFHLIVVYMLTCNLIVIWMLPCHLNVIWMLTCHHIVIWVLPCHLNVIWMLTCHPISNPFPFVLPTTDSATSPFAATTSPVAVASCPSDFGSQITIYCKNIIHIGRSKSIK